MLRNVLSIIMLVGVLGGLSACESAGDRAASSIEDTSARTAAQAADEAAGDQVLVKGTRCPAGFVAVTRPHLEKYASTNSIVPAGDIAPQATWAYGGNAGVQCAPL